MKSLLSNLVDLFKTLWPDLRSFLAGTAGYKMGENKAKKDSALEQAKQDVNAAQIHSGHVAVNRALTDSAARDKLRKRATAKGKPAR